MVGPTPGELCRTQAPTTAGSGDLQPKFDEEARAPLWCKMSVLPSFILGSATSLGERQDQVPGVPPAVLGDQARHRTSLSPKCIVPAAPLPHWNRLAPRRQQVRSSQPPSSTSTLQHQLPWQATSGTTSGTAADNGLRFLVSHGLCLFLVLNHACAFIPQVKGLRAEAEKTWGNVTVNNKATTETTPRSKALGSTPRRFLYSHDIPAKSVSNHASPSFSQVKSLRAEAAKSCSTQMALARLWQDYHDPQKPSLVLDALRKLF